MKNWNELSIKDKNDIIKVAVQNGITTLPEIRERYNEFAEGGDITDEEYAAVMEKVAENNNPIWNRYRQEEGLRPLSVDEEYLRILNDNSYNYRGYYSKYPNSRVNADTHWPDEFKTVYHPTFSDESIYSGVRSQYNPEGLVGGHWNGDTFIPAPWQTTNGYSSGGSIHIKPENRGKFTALKKRTGHSASWFKAHGTPAQRKMATFALNARKWKHGDGGYLFDEGGETEEEYYPIWLDGITVKPSGNRLTTREDWNWANWRELQNEREQQAAESVRRGIDRNGTPIAAGIYGLAAAPFAIEGLGSSAVANSIRTGLQAVNTAFTPSTWLNPVTGAKLLSPTVGTVADAGIQGAFAYEGLNGLWNQGRQGTLLSDPASTVIHELEVLPLVSLGSKAVGMGVDAWNKSGMKAIWDISRNDAPTVISSSITPKVRTRVGDVEIDNPTLLYHLDRGNGTGAFSSQGAYVKDGFLMPGVSTDKSVTPYSWWNKGKPYANTVNGEPLTRLMTSTEEAPGMLHVRSQNYPIGQWTGRRGFVTNAEYVNPEGVDVSNSTYLWEPGYGWRKSRPTARLDFLERNPSRISDAERAGIPKGDRNFKRTENPNSYMQQEANKSFDNINNHSPRHRLVTEEEISNMSPEAQIHAREGKNDFIKRNQDMMEDYFADSYEFNKDLQDYINGLDVEISPQFKPVITDGIAERNPYVAAYRNYLYNNGTDAAMISDDDIAKFLTHMHNMQQQGVTGKMADKLPLWHSSNDMFDIFDWHNTGKYTGNSGALGPGNYFSSHGATYGRLQRRNNLPKNFQPYYITGINSTPSGHMMIDKGILPDYMGPQMFQTMKQSDPKRLEEILFRPVPGANTSLYVDSGEAVQGVFEGDRAGFMLRRNDGIKSLFPHPSRLIRNEDGTVQLLPTNWSDPRVNFASGGPLVEYAIGGKLSGK